MEYKKKKKNIVIESGDISVDRRVVTNVIAPNADSPNVLEINLSMYAIPKYNNTRDGYNERVERIVKASQRILRNYVSNNQDLFDSRSILDINFTSANLRKGYNKSVQMSLFVRQNGLIKFTKIKKRIKETIKESVNMITSKINEEGFKCFKKKQTVNRNVF